MYSQTLEETELKESTLWHLKYVSDRVETCRRRQNPMTWAHHQEVAPLDPEQQTYWLDLAEKNQWKRKDLRRAIKESKPSEYPL